MGLSRKITCKQCGFAGVVEAHDTQNYSPGKIFKHLGKDINGYLHFLCPSCAADESYSPYTFINPTFKIGCFVIIFVIIWLIIKYIF